MEPHKNPDEIRFCQSSIKDHFTTGENLLSVFIKLWDGTITPSNMNGRVQAHYLTKTEREKYGFNRNNIVEDQWYAVEGNRRLYIFKKLNQAQKLQYHQIPYQDLQNIANKKWKFTTTSRGTTIRFYKPYIPPDGLGVEKRINNIVARGSVEESDRKFAHDYRGGQVIGGGGVARAAGVQPLWGGGVEAAGAGDVEEDVYYESDDDGL